ncbi:hypothetical protein [Nocardia vaccinii]|uniref:hypothetical protein n=1 Tax=Nocardia vaccinii TaxID=1822 RepID=UPI000834D4FC|nr:hypothetical protein [Nocardia vaccinii]
MSLRGPLPEHTFVYADSALAEVLCHASLMDLTVPRARELRQIHQHHRPDECAVHLEVAFLLLLEGDDGDGDGDDG